MALRLRVPGRKRFRGIPRACSLAMKEELAFLKYRREVVLAWPESARKAVFLTAIESRILSTQHLLRIAAAAVDHVTGA